MFTSTALKCYVSEYELEVLLGEQRSFFWRYICNVVAASFTVCEPAAVSNPPFDPTSLNTSIHRFLRPIMASPRPVRSLKTRGSYSSSPVQKQCCCWKMFESLSLVFTSTALNYYVSEYEFEELVGEQRSFFWRCKCNVVAASFTVCEPAAVSI